jgi:hypothetical protein
MEGINTLARTAEKATPQYWAARALGAPVGTSATDAVNNTIMPLLMPGNYAAALTEGSLNPYRGAEIRANDER